jgi:hypothetical protein
VERILYVCSSNLRDRGLGRVARHQVAALARRGLGVDFIGSPPIRTPDIRSVLWPSFPSTAISWLPRPTKRDLRWRLFGTLGARALRARDYRAVVTWKGLGWKIFPEAERQGHPYFVNCGNFPSGPRKIVEPDRPRWPGISSGRISDEYFATGAHVLVTSAYAKSRFIAAGVPEHRLYEIESGFDPEVFFAGPQRDSDAFRLLFCGRHHAPVRRTDHALPKRGPGEGATGGGGVWSRNDRDAGDRVPLPSWRRRLPGRESRSLNACRHHPETSRTHAPVPENVGELRPSPARALDLGELRGSFPPSLRSRP